MNELIARAQDTIAHNNALVAIAQQLNASTQIINRLMVELAQRPDSVKDHGNGLVDARGD